MNVATTTERVNGLGFQSVRSPSWTPIEHHYVNRFYPMTVGEHAIEWMEKQKASGAFYDWFAMQVLD